MSDITSLLEPQDQMAETEQDFIGQRVITINRRGSRREAILLGVEPDPTPELDGDFRRALVLSAQGGFTLDHVLRIPEWRGLLLAHDWTLERLSVLLTDNPDWTFTRRGRIVSIEKLNERPPSAPLRVMDSVYLVSESPNTDRSEGGEHPLPDGDLDLNRVLLVLERRSDELVVTYAPSSGARMAINPAHTKYHRLFQATSASWCPQRVTVIENVARNMRDEYERARWEDHPSDDFDPEPDYRFESWDSGDI